MRLISLSFLVFMGCKLFSKDAPVLEQQEVEPAEHASNLDTANSRLGESGMNYIELELKLKKLERSLDERKRGDEPPVDLYEVLEGTGDTAP